MHALVKTLCVVVSTQFSCHQLAFAQCIATKIYGAKGYTGCKIELKTRTSYLTAEDLSELGCQTFCASRLSSGEDHEIEDAKDLFRLNYGYLLTLDDDIADT